MKKINNTCKIILVFTLICSLLIHVACQDAAAGTGAAAGGAGTGGGKRNPAVTKALTKVSSKYLSSLSSVFKKDIEKQFGFCITDVDKDWKDAFDFEKDSRFLENCVEAKGDVMQRVCTAAEIKFYFQSFYSNEGEAKQSSFLKPNKNCNLTTWLAGCEPGWACSAAKGTKVDLKNDRVMPVRVETCSPCCEGFFCPRGITCMIPCPLGSYCPLARLNRTTGVCDPYKYQLPPGQAGHTCGGADLWADITSSREIFCSAGSYCPSTIQKLPCTSGHYCRAGSVEQQECFKMATCEPRSTNQNISAYGLMIFLGLFVLLLILYNCSDQALASREKKKEQSREKAVKSVQETAEARENWISAKDIAKKHAVGLQTQLSRTFSKVRSQRQPDLTKGVTQAKPGTDAAFGTSKQQKKGKGNLTQMLHEMDEDPDSNEGFNVDIGGKQSKKNAPKGKNLHTQSQMFRYAYGQIEKEKALQEHNQNLTFSGVLSMANEIDIPKRFTIEIEFKELTITLKGKNIHLMRSVSGKLSPGKVSAVMGPSGAGKTTFLSALTGKAPGCNVTGKVLINGKDEPIQAYKKIIGYVPQDDIVHGNLTVEENLWFSARCRLSSDLQQQDKVLVIERIIESLGLQAVRHSLVGTVEKRGISGGQKKRVNVGLEMVMEPSLLILDEPTSGLDSSSSQLLLKALRREALEGVNICMVIHQPSYTLFNMFDELILLAKGGLIVYHGSVKKLEDYFAGLGITVPDRANPPDYFIDILEGIIKLPPNISVTSTKQLPVRWMLHNGYPVPLDMLQLVEGAKAPASEDSIPGENKQCGNAPAPEETSLVGELWQTLKCSVVTTKDLLQLDFLKSADLSKRNTPGPFKQSRYYLGRIGKQRLRESRIQVVDHLILLLAGICLGTLAKVSDETFGAIGYTYTVIAVSLLCKIAALRSFSPDKLHYWRERSSGMSSLAYFLAKDTVDHFNTIVKPIVYLSMFYFFNNPRSSINDNYLVLVCLVYCVTGMAYVLAILLQPAPAQLWSVLLPVVLTLIATQENDSKVVQKISDMCYTKWAMEAFVVSNAKRYSGVWLITRCGSLMQNGYDLKRFNRCLLKLILTGVSSRALAFICMIIFLKK